MQKTYLESIMPVFGKNGGKPIARYKAVEQLMGEQGPEMVALIEFPSRDTIKSMISSNDFKALDDLRQRAFKKLNLIICDEM
jgi:uncharacterized protein (DUF1330 family)